MASACRIFADSDFRPHVFQDAGLLREFLGRFRGARLLGARYMGFLNQARPAPGFTPEQWYELEKDTGKVTHQWTLEMLDRPLVLVTDAGRLEIEYISVASPFVGMDTIPDDAAGPDPLTSAFIASFFGPAVGLSITDIRVDTADEYDNWNISYVPVGRQDAYITTVSIVFEDGRSLCFAQEFDYGTAWFEKNGQRMRTSVDPWWGSPARARNPE